LPCNIFVIPFIKEIATAQLESLTYTKQNKERNSILKIAIVVGTFPYLSESFILNHITGLIDAGHEVTVFSSRPPAGIFHPDFTRYDLANKTHYPHIPRLKFRFLYLPKMLWQLKPREALYCMNFFRHGIGALSLKALYVFKGLATGNFDIIHCHFGQNGMALYFLGKLLHTPLVTSFHGRDLIMFGRFGHPMYKKLFRFGDAFVANSNYGKECLVRMGCLADKIVKIPEVPKDPGVDFIKKESISNTTHILTVARLVESKGVHVCLRAIQLLREADYDVNYTVVGDGPCRHKLEKLAEKLGIRHIVNFTGWMQQEEVYRRYMFSDIFVLSSIRGKDGWVEAQGMVIQEAQLHGLPVVASRIGGIPDGVDNGKAGLLFEPGNPFDLAKQLRILLDDRVFAKNIAETGIQYCHTNYSRSIVMKQFADLYSSLVKNR